MGTIKGKYISLILLILTFFYMVTYAEPSPWAKDSIYILKANDMIDEELISYDKLQKNITRTEFTDLMVRLYGHANKINIESIKGLDPFEDTDNAMVSKAYALGLVKGVNDPNTIFLPNRDIKRQELATMLLSIIKELGIPVVIQKPARFYDMSLVSDWAKEAIDFTTQEGILQGMDNNRLEPLASTTREQAIVLIHRLAERYGWIENGSGEGSMNDKIDHTILLQDFVTLENGYMVPKETKLLISSVEESGLHLRLTAEDQEGNRNLRQMIEELLLILEANGVQEKIINEFKKTIEDSWTIGFNGPRINDPLIKVLEDGKWIELACDYNVRVSIYTPFIKEGSLANNALTTLATGYKVPKKTQLQIRTDPARGYKLEITIYEEEEPKEIKEQLNQVLSILKTNNFPQSIIDFIHRDMISNWNYWEDKPGKIYPVWLELPNGDQLVYSADGFVQLKIFSF